jgi:hypothetical protein
MNYIYFPFSIPSHDVKRHIKYILKIKNKNSLAFFKNNYRFWDFEKSIT